MGRLGWQFNDQQLYFGRELPPSEEEFFSELQHLVAPLREKPVTIRLLDIGGDKAIPSLRLPFESNPLLGKRGVRLLLDYPQVAHTQLKTLLRLSQAQDIASSCRWSSSSVTCNRYANCSWRSLTK